MRRILFAALLLLPVAVHASTFQAAQSLSITEPPSGTSYLAGVDVRVATTLPSDLLSAAGTLNVAAPVAGDVTAAAGSATFASSTSGALRVAGGMVRIAGDVGGEVVALGSSIIVTGHIKDIHAAGGTIDIRNGAAGAVALYGGTVTLAGDFTGDVRVVASDRITLAPGTHIHGSFEYNAPQEVDVPQGAVVDEGVHYIGSSSFLPSASEARTFAIAGIGIFFLVRLVAAVLAAGLVAGLFPQLANAVAEEALGKTAKHAVLLTLLGFVVIIATPLATILLIASFVGIGIAALIGAAYLLLLLLAYVYAATLAGAAIMRTIFKRRDVPWKAAVLGMIVLFLIGLVPAAGFFVTFVLSAAALGALLRIFYRFAFTAGGDV